MPIPALTAEGLLPTGIHDCSLEEIREHFGHYGSRGHRWRQCDRLENYVRDVCSGKLAEEIIVDGSFVTEKDEPGDIDLIVVLPEHHDFGAELRPIEYNLLSRRRVRRRFEFDILVAPRGSQTLAQFVGYFEQVRNRPKETKGLLRVVCDHDHE
jgi:hypothetical protein